MATELSKPKLQAFCFVLFSISIVFNDPDKVSLQHLKLSVSMKSLCIKNIN